MRNNSRSLLLRAQAGFTLVEMIVVLVIISLLMGFLLKGIWGSSQGAKAKLTEMKLQKLKSSINQYQLMRNKLPGSLQALASCEDQSSGAACLKVADEEDLKDAWDTNLVFQVDGSGRSYRIKSLGADGKEGGSGTDGDIFIDGP